MRGRKMGCLQGLLLGVVVCFISVVSSAPLPPPDLWKCAPIHIKPTYFAVDCCLPVEGKVVKEFKYDLEQPVRVRKSAHEVDDEFIAKYNKAYEIMRALPPTDPRSFHVQSNIHCGYCAEVYRQQNSSQVIEMHRNWLLFPFHRWYVYFHEKILGSLIGDPDFAIPFWNWDNQSLIMPFPNSMPSFFADQPSLFDPFRDRRHQPHKIIDLHWGPLSPLPNNMSDMALRPINHAFMHQTVVSGGSLPELFLGGKFKYNDPAPYGASSFEIGPHASVHGWVGDEWQPKGEDMAPAYSAARDPMFWSHHSNVDRLWEEWKQLGGRRGDFEDPDWHDASFYFYDENADLVRVTVGQALEIEKLRYTYDWVENEWTKDRSVRLSSPASGKRKENGAAVSAINYIASWLGYSSAGVWSGVVDVPEGGSGKAGRFAGAALRARIARPHAIYYGTSKLAGLEEVLHIEGILVPSKEPVWFDVFINLPDADEETPITATEWCGRFMNGPHFDQANHMDVGVFFKVSIGEKLRKLEIADQDTLVVSLVPKGMHKHGREVHIGGIRVDLV